MIGKEVKNEYSQEYTMSKIVETFFFMRKVEAIDYVDQANIKLENL